MSDVKIFTLCHNNDHKEKWQSHSVYVKSPWDGFQFDDCGYGATQEEAFEDFKQKFYKAKDNLDIFESMLKTDALPFIETDCLGNEIKEK
jgi:hypothetical protein